MKTEDKIIQELTEAVIKMYQGRLINPDQVKACIIDLLPADEPAPDLTKQVYYIYLKQFPDNRYPDENMNWEHQ